VKKQKYKSRGQLKVKIHILFYGNNSWIVALDLKAHDLLLNQPSLVHYFIWLGDGPNFWGYVGRNAELVCEELCNFLKCHIFVTCFTCC
jgi:hypothetical protein